MLVLHTGISQKKKRIETKFPKEHYIDARCISGHPAAVPTDTVYYQKKVRCHNRQFHKATILKGGIEKNNQAPKDVKGIRLFDTVRYKNKFFVFGRRLSGFFDIHTLDGTKVNTCSLSSKKINLIYHNNGWFTERKEPHSSPA